MTLERQLTNGKVRDLLAATKNQKNQKNKKRKKTNHYKVVMNCTVPNTREGGC